MNAQTGLGRANGTAVADDDWWEEHTKVLRLVCLKSSWTVHFILYTQWLMRTDFLQGNSELKKLRNGPPEWLDQLEVMFEQLVVDVYLVNKWVMKMKKVVNMIKMKGTVLTMGHQGLTINRREATVLVQLLLVLKRNQRALWSEL